MSNLWLELVVQGGDLGYLVSRFLPIKYGADHVRAHHVNNSAPAEPTVTANPDLHAKIQSTALSASDKAGLGRSEWFQKERNGYLRKQSTKPQTVSYFIADSPIGWLAWIYEALHDWSDNCPWTEDKILTWISIYYFSRAGPGASNSIYYALEHTETPAFAAAQAFSNVPIVVSRFPRDSDYLAEGMEPDTWAGRT